MLNKAIVARWFASFWGASYNPAIVDELAAPDVLLQYSMHNPPARASGREGLHGQVPRGLPRRRVPQARCPHCRPRHRRRPLGGKRHTCRPCFPRFRHRPFAGRDPAARSRSAGTPPSGLENGMIVEEAVWSTERKAQLRPITGGLVLGLSTGEARIGMRPSATSTGAKVQFGATGMNKFGSKMQGRVEDGRLLRGTGRYTDDVTLPNMLYGAVLRSPHAAARIRSVDTAAAQAVAGVVAVYMAQESRRRRHRANTLHGRTAEPRRHATTRSAASGARGRQRPPYRRPRSVRGGGKLAGGPGRRRGDRHRVRDDAPGD